MKLLNVFEQEIQKLKVLNKESVFIGGSCALVLHGLNIDDPEDLDIIIYDPTKDLFDYILNSKYADCSDYSESSDPEPSIIKERDVFEMFDSDSGLKVNVIIERKREAPISRLFYYYLINGELELIEVNPISEIIEAKKLYNRSKDREQIMEIIAKNFYYG